MAPPKTRSTRGGGALLAANNDQNAFGGIGGGGGGGGGGLAVLAQKSKTLKRKADASPVRNDKVKRSALGNLTNAAKENQSQAPAPGKPQMVTRKRTEPAVLATSSIAGAAELAATKQPLGLLSTANAENILGSSNGPAAHNAKLLAQQQLQQQCLAAPRPTKVLTRAAARATLPGDTVQPATAATTKKATAAAAAQQPAAGGQVAAGAQAKQQQQQQQQLDAPVVAKPRRRISNEFDRNREPRESRSSGIGAATLEEENSLYMSALESVDSAASDRLSLALASFAGGRSGSVQLHNLSASSDISLGSEATAAIDGLRLSSRNSSRASSNAAVAAAVAAAERMRLDSRVARFDELPETRCPADVADFDGENWDDIFQVSHYAMDIFNYLKTRESAFAVQDYIGRQHNISKWMRSLLVDWMVEVQETFELNHETLYLAVKVVDVYLSRVVVVKDKLQLLGAAAMFVACKYDERTPPLIEDFLYICDGAYVQKELIHMEMEVFKVIGYDLGMPLSYRFLRRYARVSKVPMAILTLARYILEFSLMNYATVTLSESKLAAAALFVALRMSQHGHWDATLRYYTGYELIEIAHVVIVLNANLHQKPREAIKTVRNKYSHKIFFEVAKIPLLTANMLFAGTGITHESPAFGL